MVLQRRECESISMQNRPLSHVSQTARNRKERSQKVFKWSGTRLNHRHFAFYPHPMHMREELVDFDRQVFDLGDFFCFSFRKLVIGYEPR